MDVIEGFDGLADGQKGASAAIGNFDGVHLGHQALIRAARTASGGEPVAVVTFEPHPRRLFQPDAPPFRLTTPEEKARLLAALGVDRLHILTFDRAFASMPAENFIVRVIARGLGLRHVVVGTDFRFGKGRCGDVALLEQKGSELGFGVTAHDLLGAGDEDYASTAIRKCVEAGDCEGAAAQLGRWHGVSGPVMEGDRRGRDLGYPTANLVFGEQVIPRYGVYASVVEIHDGPHAGTWEGVASIGERPTFGKNEPNFEVHLFGFSGDLYGAPITARLVRLLRGEVAFEGAEALIAQMDRDSADAKAALAEARPPS